MFIYIIDDRSVGSDLCIFAGGVSVATSAQTAPHGHRARRVLPQSPLAILLAVYRGVVTVASEVGVPDSAWSVGRRLPPDEAPSSRARLLNHDTVSMRPQRWRSAMEVVDLIQDGHRVGVSDAKMTRSTSGWAA